MAAKSNRFRSALLASTSMLAGGSLLTAHPVSAQSILPTQGVVTSGVASIHQSGADLSVNQTTPRAIVNWSSFSIGQSNAVTFNQPNAFSAILNRVTGTTTSTIAGQLNANGQVYLVNPNGIAITRTGAVRVGGGFVASTLQITDGDFNSGNLSFTGQGASAAVSNAGAISAASGGFVGLLGGTVSNSGAISVPLGKVGLGSGEQATLNLTGDNFLQVALPTGAKTADGQALVDVTGKVRAAGGSVQLKAATVATAIRDAVNVSGVVSASSARASGGSIILGGGPGGNVSVTGRLVASGRTKGGAIAIGGRNVALGRAKLVANSAHGRGGSATVTGTNAVSLVSTTVDASGATGGGAIRIGGDFHGASDVTSARTTTVDSASTLNASATSSGDGGTVAVWSDASTAFAGHITATGGPSDGNGGYAEVSANPATRGVLTYSGFADLTAPKGTTGTLLLDPFNITICDDCDEFGGSFSGGVYTPTATSAISASTLETQLTTANVLVSTGLSGSPGTDAGNLTVSAPVTWASANSLTLTAASGIFVDSAIASTGGGSLALNGGASVNIFSPISTATGGITVTGPAFLSANVTTAGGPITFNNAVTLDANVTINSGAGTTTFGSTVDSGPTGFSSLCGAGCDLTVSGGVVNFDANVGSGTPLGALNASGLVNLTGNVTTNNGAITFNNAVELGADATVNSGAAITTFAGTVDGGHLLSVTGGTVNFDANVGSSTPLSGLSVAGPVNLSGNVTTSGGAITFDNAVTLGANARVNSGSGTTTFGGTVDGGNFLTVAGGTVTFDGNIGSTTPLGGLSASGAVNLFGNVTTAGGAITFNNTVTLDANVTINSGSGTTTFDGTVDSGPTGFSSLCGAGCDLTVSGGVVNFDANVGSGTPLGGLIASGLVNLSGNVITNNGVIAFNNAVVLGADALVNSGAGITTFASTVDGDHALTVSGGTVNFDADVGSGTPLGGLTVTGPVFLSGNVTTNNGAITFNSAVGLDANVTLNSGTATTTFGSTVDSSCVDCEVPLPENLTATAGEFSFGGALGGINPLGAVSLTSTNGMTLPSITATTIVAQTTGAAADLTLGSGTILTASGSGTPVTLGAGHAFINDSGNGSGAINLTSDDPPRWLIYLSNPAIDPAVDPAIVVPAGLDSDATAVWNTPFGGAVSAGGDRYVFAFQPLITVTSGNLSKTYGQDVTPLVAADYTITGLEPGLSGAFQPDTAGAVYSGTPSVTSLGAPALAPVTGSPYPITVGQGGLVIGDGYGFAANSTGLLSVAPLQLTASLVGTVEKTYDGTTAATLNPINYSLTGFVGSQSATVTQTSGTYTSPNVGSGIGVSATLASGDFTAGSGTLLTNYVLPSSASGDVGVIDPKPLTFAVANALGIYGTTATLGAATLFGIVPGDVVDPTVGAFSGPIRIIPNPLTPPGAYLQDVTALSNPNYSIASSGNLPGVLTIINSPDLSTVAPSLVYPGSQLQSGLAAAAAAGAAAGLGFKSAISCDAGPLLSARRLYSDPANAVKALSNMVSQFIEQCERPTQANVADALDQYADALAKIAPSFPPELRNLPTIVHEAARRVRAAPDKAAAVAVLRQTVATIRKEISLVRSEDPDVQSRQVRDGEAVAETLTVAGEALVNSGGL